MIKTDPARLSVNRFSFDQEGQSKLMRGALDLVRNEVVQGKVLRLLSQNRALLLIDGKQVVAKTHIPLQEGRTFTLITDSVSPVLSFKPAGIPYLNRHSPNIPLVLSALKENIWAPILIRQNSEALSGEAFYQLNSLLKDLTLGPFTQISPDLLRRFIDKSGLSWEAKLRKGLNRKNLRADFKHLLKGDLKGLASRLFISEENNQTIEHLITIIKNVQLFNQADHNQGNKLFFPIPVQFPEGGFSVARLLVHLPGKEHPDGDNQKHHPQPMRISLYMELSVLGPVYASLCLTGKTVTGKFLFNKPEVQSMVEEKMPLLIDRLKENGYTTCGMICSLAEDDVIEKSLTNELYHPDDSGFNLVI